MWYFIGFVAGWIGIDLACKVIAKCGAPFYYCLCSGISGSLLLNYWMFL